MRWDEKWNILFRFRDIDVFVLCRLEWRVKGENWSVKDEGFRDKGEQSWVEVTSEGRKVKSERWKVKGEE